MNSGNRGWRPGLAPPDGAALTCETMPTSEPFATALLLAIAGLLMGASVLFSRASNRIGVPIVLLFLCIGMLAGSEGLGRIDFEDYGFAFRLGTLALALILFDGGLNTPLAALRRTWAPAGMLATAGVALTALLIALPAHFWGLSWPEALVLGAVVSSTDAASVFAVLRGSGLQLKRRVGTTLELESGLNDPVAVILTTALTANLLHPGELSAWRIVLEVRAPARHRWRARRGHRPRRPLDLLRRYPLPTGGLYPALTLAFALLAFGVTTLVHGSGFLAVYLAGMVLGNGPLPYHNGLLRVHDALAWLAQIGMFLDPRAAGVPEPAAGGGAQRARPGDSLGVRGAAAGGGVLPGVVPVSFARGGIHRMGGASGRGADRAGDVPGAGRGAGRGPDLPRGVLHRGGQRAGAGGDGGLGDPAAGAAEGGGAGAAGGAGDRVAAAAGGRADVVLCRRGAGGDGSDARRIWSFRRGRA